MYDRAQGLNPEEELKVEDRDFDLGCEIDRIDKELYDIRGKAHESPTIFRQQPGYYDTPTTGCVMSGDKYMSYKSHVLQEAQQQANAGRRGETLTPKNSKALFG